MKIYQEQLPFDEMYSAESKVLPHLTAYPLRKKHTPLFNYAKIYAKGGGGLGANPLQRF